MIISISAAPIVDTAPASATLSKKHGLSIHDDPMREICSQYGFQTIYEMPAGLQARVREDLIRQHFELVSSENDLLLNYSVFEWLADWMRWFWSSTSTERWEDIMKSAGLIAQRYGVIYHIESNASRNYDGYVWLDQRNSAQINGLIKWLYGEFNVANKVRQEIS